MPKNPFSTEILKAVVGKERATAFFGMLSTAVKTPGTEMISMARPVKRTNSGGDIGAIFKSQLISMSVLKGMKKAK